MPVFPTLSTNALQPLAPFQPLPVVPLSNDQIAALLKAQNAPLNVVQIFTAQSNTNAPGTLPPQVLTLGIQQDTTDLQFVGSLWKTKLATLGGLNTFLIAQAADTVGPQGFLFGFSGSASRWRSQITIRFGQPDFDLYVIEFYIHNHSSAPYAVETGYGAFSDSGDGTTETVISTQTIPPNNTGPVLLSVTNDQAAKSAFLRFPAAPGYQASLSFVRIHPLSY